MSEEIKNEEATQNKTITLEDVKQYLETDSEAKRWLQAEKDRTVTKGIETWKENNLDKIINEKISEKYPEETEEQKRLKDLEQKLASVENARVRETLRNKALSKLTENGLPTQLADLVVGKDEESTMSKLDMIQQLWDNGMKQQVESKFKENGRQPAESPNKVEKLTKEQIAKMSPEKINELFDKDPGLFEKL